MSHATPARVALLGCGEIAGQYLAELERRPSVLELTTCADLDIGRARQATQALQVLEVMTGLLASVQAEGEQVAMTTAWPLELSA
jgi:predicted dehydrogenase